MDRRNWMELSKTLIQKYKICSLFSSLKNLPLEIFITAVSSFSGPIAVMVDKGINHQFILPPNFNNSIAIFTCKGQLKKTIPYNAKDRILYMGFTRIEQLLIIQASGDYWLIDPFSGQINQGNYSTSSYSTPQKQQRYKGCQFLANGKLVLLRQKQLGFAENPKSPWQALNDLKIKLQNPIFSSVFGSVDQFAFLTRQHSIQVYNTLTGQRTTLYSDNYLNANWERLLALSYNKQYNTLGLVFCNPPIIFYIDIPTNNHKRLDAMIELKYDLSFSNTPGLTKKYPSKSIYKPSQYTLGWLNNKCNVMDDVEDIKNSILVFGNPKLLLMYDGQSTRLSPRSNCNQMISVQFDCLRVYTEDSHQIYRVVPYLYQTIVQINKINQGYYIDRFQKIIQLHDQYTNYLEKDIIDLSKLDKVWKMGNRSVPIPSLSDNHSNTISQSASPLLRHDQNQFEGLDSNIFINKQNTKDIKQKIQRIQDQIIRPLIKSVRFCIDPVDQVKMLKFICFIKNLYNCSIDIYQLCGQMRIINNLKFEFFNRTLTVNQFQYLKYQAKDRFLTILLRYNMHFIGDTIFGDSDSKYKIFLHWSKCKIQKSNEAIAFEEIKQKFESTPKKHRNMKVFTDIAKYCLDRGKQTLAENLIQLDQNPDRKIVVYLLVLANKNDKKVVQKLLNCAQESTRSFLIYRVVRQLTQAQWVENYAWINILYQKPNVSRHYIRYLKAYGKQDLLKNYFLQNKDYQNLGLYGIEKALSSSNQQQTQIPKYSEQALNSFLPKVQQFKKFLPNLSSVTKSYAKNTQMELLRKVKSTDYVPSQEELRQIKNDIILEYLGQILFQKQKFDTAVSAIVKIKTEKVFGILLRKQRYRDAVELAFERKNKQALLQISERCSPQLQAQIAERLPNLNKK